MILKIKYEPHKNMPEFNCWVYLDCVEKLELYRETLNEANKRLADGWFTNKDEHKKECQCKVCTSNKTKYVVSVSVYRNGKYERYSMDKDFYILSNDGKTVEKVVV